MLGACRRGQRCRGRVEGGLDAEGGVTGAVPLKQGGGPAGDRLLGSTRARHTAFRPLLRGSGQPSPCSALSRADSPAMKRVTIRVSVSF